MTAPAPGTSFRLMIVGGSSAAVGVLIHLILPLTYGSLDSDRDYDSQPWEAKRFGFAVTRFFGTSLTGGGLGLADFAVILGAVAIALAIAIRGFEPKVPRPVAPQGYPQGAYAGQYAQPQAAYAQPQPGQYAQPPAAYAQPQPGQYAQPQPGQVPTGQAQPGQVGQDQAGQAETGQPPAPEQGAPQQPWGGAGS